LAYNVKEKPQEFREKMINSGKSIAGILTNPLSTCKSIYHVGKNMFAEAQKDPLKAGKLQGEIAVFGGTLLLGGGQVKSVAKTGVVVTNAVKTGAMANRANLGILANTASWAEKMNSSITAFSASIPRIDLIFTRPTLNVAIDTTLKKPSKISGSYCEQSFLNSRSLHFSIKNLSKELNGGFLGDSLQYSYKVGDKIDGIAITGKKENRLFLQNKGILYENTINEDVPKISKFINFEQVGDVWKASGKIADGTYAYVISKDNQLLIAGRKFNHSWLTGGEPVRYAGELTFKNGKFINWNNKSGHYLPDPEDALNVKHIIKGVLNEGDNFVAIGREQIRNQIKNQIRKMN